jgi:hypothetical protein
MNTSRTTRASRRRAERLKNDLLRFVLDAKQQGKTVMAYGAAAKGNTLLNFAGIRADLVSCAVDLNPAKQGATCPAAAFRSSRSSTWKRRGPTTCSSCPGT